MKINNSVNAKEYKLLSKLVNKAIISDKNQITKKNVEASLKKPKQLWNTAKEKLYGRNKNMTETIVENDKMKIGSKHVASVLNRFFITKPKKIVNNLPKNDIDPMSYYKKYVPNYTNEFKLQPINMSELRIAMSKIKNTKSCDFYGLSMAMINKIKTSIAPILLNLINQTILQSKFPEQLKISKIIPIPKSNDYTNPNNYRGVNIFNPISKVIEKVWSIQIIKYLK